MQRDNRCIKKRFSDEKKASGYRTPTIFLDGIGITEKSVWKVCSK